MDINQLYPRQVAYAYASLRLPVDAILIVQSCSLPRYQDAAMIC
jgi:hypothetical protein